MTSPTQTAYFATGCFWDAERRFWQLTGVISTSVGYMGGDKSNPTYEEVCTGSTAHAEIVAIRNAAARLQNSRLDGCTMVVTLEPCAMCAGAIAQSRISHLIFGAWDEKAGAVGSVWDVLRDPRSIFSVEVTAGVRESECAQLLKDFFSDK